ncbi:MAG: hydantoinase/oxoprolinase N-terminal domain-containing protein [Bacillota bacterium]
MTLGLGIDTGGTFTDSVLMELETKRVLGLSKAHTTQDDLCVGIKKSLQALDHQSLRRVGLVSLSTTLATNSIVEGRGGVVGYLLIGSGVERPLPSRYVASLRGGHTMSGHEREPLDEQAARLAIEAMKDHVDAFAVTGFFSVRNPEHELRVRDIITGLCELPCVCGHELTQSLGFYERALTAGLNAGLLPLIRDLIDSVRSVLSNFGISAPLMVVRGDGALISEQVARQRPVETILSGPAASVSGAAFLSDQSEGIVVDIGGTTTDISVINEGRPRVRADGAVVNSWATRVSAVDAFTIGAGGDSEVGVNADGKVTVGPKRAVPLCFLASRYPYLADELKEIEEYGYDPVLHQPVHVAVLAHTRSARSGLTGEEGRVLSALAEGPHSLFHLGKMLGSDPNLLPLAELERRGILIRACITPTDVLHFRGEYVVYERRVAEAGMRILARRGGMDSHQLAACVLEQLTRRIASGIIEKLVMDARCTRHVKKDHNYQYFVNEMCGDGNGKKTFQIRFAVAKPIIGIGAPASAYLPEVARRLCARLVIPPHSEVANAVGAISGDVVESVECLIRSDENGYFLVHSPRSRRIFRSMDDALAYAEREGADLVTWKAALSGAHQTQVISSRDESWCPTGLGGADPVFVEARVKVTAFGKPRWEAKDGHE